MITIRFYQESDALAVGRLISDTYSDYNLAFLPPMGWTFLAPALANIVTVLGWGDWFPWAVPILVGGMVQAHADRLGLHSYLVVLLALAVGLLATFAWWRSADQAR